MSLFTRAERYLGITEIPGEDDHPLIRWWHSLTSLGEASDEVPWCSSFVNGVCWDERKPRSRSAAARSWLDVGVARARFEGSDFIRSVWPPALRERTLALFDVQVATLANQAMNYLVSGNAPGRRGREGGARPEPRPAALDPDRLRRADVAFLRELAVVPRHTSRCAVGEVDVPDLSRLAEHYLSDRRLGLDLNEEAIRAIINLYSLILTIYDLAALE